MTPPGSQTLEVLPDWRVGATVVIVECEHLGEELAVLVDELLPLFAVARILDELLGGSLSQTMSDRSIEHGIAHK
jgi:hypothetical protein